MLLGGSVRRLCFRVAREGVAEFEEALRGVARSLEGLARVSELALVQALIKLMELARDSASSPADASDLEALGLVDLWRLIDASRLLDGRILVAVDSLCGAVAIEGVGGGRALLWWISKSELASSSHALDALVALSRVRELGVRGLAESFPPGGHPMDTVYFLSGTRFAEPLLELASGYGVHRSSSGAEVGVLVLEPVSEEWREIEIPVLVARAGGRSLALFLPRGIDAGRIAELALSALESVGYELGPEVALASLRACVIELLPDLARALESLARRGAAAIVEGDTARIVLASPRGAYVLNIHASPPLANARLCGVDSCDSLDPSYAPEILGEAMYRLGEEDLERVADIVARASVRSRERDWSE